MDLVVNFGVAWLVFLAPALIGSLPIWIFGKGRAHWFKWEIICILTVPFLVWICLYLVATIRGSNKSVSNMIWEAVALGCSIPLAELLRLLLVGQFEQEHTAIGAVIFVCIVTAVIWRFTPLIVGK